MRVFKNKRMDSSWDFRKTYDEGRKLIAKQDAWCANPKEQKEEFPDDLQWEAVADIIRGNVKVNVHCYETVDLNDMVRISNEFQVGTTRSARPDDSVPHLQFPPRARSVSSS